MTSDELLQLERQMDCMRPAALSPQQTRPTLFSEVLNEATTARQAMELRVNLMSCGGGDAG